MKDKIPFNASEIEDVRIIIKAKGKHWSIIVNKEKEKEEDVDARYLRIALLVPILKVHDIVSTALEDVNIEKLRDERV